MKISGGFASLLAVVIFNNAVGVASSANFNVNIDNATGSFGLYVDGVQWLTSGPIAVHIDGTWYRSDDKSLTLKSFYASNGSDIFGSYQRSHFSWVAGTSSFNTYFRVYDDEMIVFGHVWPRGAINTAVGDNEDVISAFPTFQKTSGTPLNYLTFEGCFAAPHLGHFDAAAQIPGGADAGVPLVLYNADLRTVVLSPLRNFMVGVQTVSASVDNTIAFGIQGLVEKIPNNFVHETVAVAGQGVNQAMFDWGSVLLKQGGKTRSTVDSDVIIQQLGYWTDNGAYYYYNTEPNKTYEQTTVDTKAYLDSTGLPVRNWQFDSWWYFKGNHSGVSLWEPRPDVFPDGFGYIQNDLKMPLTLHNRYFANNSTYLANYTFIVEEFCALPLDVNLFLDIMGKAKGWGMVVYEQDWLITTYEMMQCTQNDVYNAHDWLKAMGEAAAQLNLTIQYCMPLPNHLLQSTAIQAVTQSRASGDYNPGNDQWQIGYPSMLLWSLGLMPFKDDFWTTSNQPNCPASFRGGCVEPNPVLETLVATLSAGPVGFSDAIGHTDIDLVMHTTRADGVLLKADKPATPVEKVLLQFDFTVEPQLYQVWSSSTTIGGNTWMYVLGADLPSAVTLVPADLGLAASGSFVAWDYFGNQSTPTPFDAAHPIAFEAAKQAVPVDFSYYTVAPVLSSGWALVGEVDKFVTVSAQRVSSVTASSNGVSVIFNAGAAEKTAWLFFTNTGDLISVTCSGSATITCVTGTGCSC